MKLPEDLVRGLREFPPALVRLIEAELAAGNHVEEIGAGFPAPPVGACARLAREVSTRPRESGDGLVFYDRNSSIYSGEWTDEKRYFFVLEPPRPYEEPLSTRPVSPIPVAKSSVAIASAPKSRDADVTALPVGSDALRRFNQSLVMTYEKWHDGEGYDLDALNEMLPHEREQVERNLTGNASRGWREVEALAALNTPGARTALRQALADGSAEVRTAILRYAPELADRDARTSALIAAIKTADVYAGLSDTLSAVQAHHPKEVIDALLEGVRESPPTAAMHYAAMLLYLHDQASAPFDWSLRPFLLQFATEDRAARENPYRELCQRIGR